VPQEAFIGIVYIVAAAAGVILLSHTPSGDEENKGLRPSRTSTPR
jgi:ABC-type Mn2+/Zn2+ transport system permease subunit